MTTRSDISWTDFSGGDANFVLRGKQKGDCEISPGCANCYAYRLRKINPDQAADFTMFSQEKLTKLVKYKFFEDGRPFRRGSGTRPLVFLVDMGDLFHENVPDDFIFTAIHSLAARRDVDWQILTKRVERMADLLAGLELPDNIWVGATCENQKMADKRIPLLVSIKAGVRFVSCEPMLEKITLPTEGVDWVICGGESGSNRRPFSKEWAFDLLEQCKAAGIPFFYKQGSALRPGHDDLLDGREVKEFPTFVLPQVMQMSLFDLRNSSQ